MLKTVENKILTLPLPRYMTLQDFENASIEL